MSVLEKMRRLREMPLEEIASRSMREARISWERLHLLMNGRPAGRIRLRDFFDIGKLDDPGRTVVGQDSETETEVLHGYFVRRPSRFFFSFQDQERLVTAYARTFPVRIAELRSTADELCAHRFRIFAYPPVNGGQQIAWRSDLVHGIASGLEHWGRSAMPRNACDSLATGCLITRIPAVSTGPAAWKWRFALGRGSGYCIFCCPAGR